MNEQRFQIGVKAVLTNDKGEMLLLWARAGPNQEWKEHWDLPGGRIKKGEDIESALMREVEEETGVSSIEIVRIFDANISKIWSNKSGEDDWLLFIVYHCRFPKNAVLKMSDEHLHYKWVTPKEAAAMLGYKFSDGFAERLKRL